MKRQNRCPFTSSAVIRETGFSDLPTIIHDKFTDELNADLQLILLAKSLGVPLISEDKKLLLQASRLNLKYFNALMILNFLLFKKTISINQFHDFRNKLLAVARYGESVIEYGESVTQRILTLPDNFTC